MQNLHFKKNQQCKYRRIITSGIGNLLNALLKQLKA